MLVLFRSGVIVHVLRLEAGLRLYGQDMDDHTDPYSCGLGWRVKPKKGGFIGSAALARLDPKHPPRRFAGITLEGRAIARHGQRVFADGRDVGEVTSGTYSFTLDHSIATVSVDGDLPIDADLSIDIRGTLPAAAGGPLPFYRRPRGALTWPTSPATASPPVTSGSASRARMQPSASATTRSRS